VVPSHVRYWLVVQPSVIATVDDAIATAARREQDYLSGRPSA
jgi:hypothetical protein